MHKTYGKFTFDTDYVNKKSYFLHTCTIWIGNTKIAYCAAKYYNRTWEAFTYQTVMLRCIDTVVDQYPELSELRKKLEDSVDGNVSF